MSWATIDFAILAGNNNSVLELFLFVFGRAAGRHETPPESFTNCISSAARSAAGNSTNEIGVREGAALPHGISLELSRLAPRSPRL